MRRLGIVIAAAMLVPGSVRSQPSIVRGQPAVDAAVMDEDIEILRRIIGRALSSHWSDASHFGILETTMRGNSLRSGFERFQPRVFFDVLSPMAGAAGMSGGMAGHANVGAVPFSIEGSYLHGHGIVYHLTLPPTDRDAVLPSSETTAPAKATSEWEQVRRELHGQPPAKSAATKRVTLHDTLLQVLAENGKNLSQLSAAEKVSIIVTFRPQLPMTGGAAMSGGMPGMGDGMAGGVGSDTGAGPPPGSSGAGAGVGGPGGGVKELRPERELELLADMHYKRENYKEAALAFERLLARVSSIQIDPSLPPAEAKALSERANAWVAEVRRRVIDAHLRNGDLAAAQKVLANPLVKIGDHPPATSLTKQSLDLPGKLTITVSKQLLDKVGSGALPFAEFRNQVSWTGSGIEAKK